MSVNLKNTFLSSNSHIGSRMIQGKYANAYVTKPISETETKVVQDMCNDPFYNNAKIALMPDFETYNGGMVGLSATISPDKINKIPSSIIGNDIGCGMLLVKTNAKKQDLDYRKIDDFIKFELFNKGNKKELPKEIAKKLEQIRLFLKEENYKDIIESYSTLGNGNHFIEIDFDENEYAYIVVHTGSRKLGYSISQQFQNPNSNTQSSISYFEACKIANEFAKSNRKAIVEQIMRKFNLKTLDLLDCPHNYIADDYTIHKGSIEAKKGQKIIIPLNMRDGVILGTGKGNSLWNNSAPHGSGRKLARSEAKQQIDISQYYKAMAGIYTTSASRRTLDEAPQAYNDTGEFLQNVAPTVNVETVLLPAYNYKRK